MKYAESSVPMCDQPDAGGVQPARQLVPAEDPQAEERRLEEEREQPLDGQRRAEDVADEPGVVDQFIPNWNSCTMPVTTPIAKLIRNSLPKNLREPQPLGVAGAHPGGLA